MTLFQCILIKRDKMERPTTNIYNGRQVDLELLRHVNRMLPNQRVFPNIASDSSSDDTSELSSEQSSRIVSGIEKAIQRYTKVFLTTINSVRLDPSVGNSLYRSIKIGNVPNISYLNHLYAIANLNTISTIRKDDENTETFGSIPDDERIVSTSLEDVRMDRNSGTIKIQVFINTASGYSFTFVIPVESGLK